MVLCFTRALDAPLLPAISDLSIEQPNDTKRTIVKQAQLLNDCAINPEAMIHFYTSNLKSNSTFHNYWFIKNSYA
jgi:hypothetical protein